MDARAECRRRDSVKKKDYNAFVTEWITLLSVLPASISQWLSFEFLAVALLFSQMVRSHMPNIVRNDSGMGLEFMSFLYGIKENIT